jgi:alpha-galactosidase
MRRVPIFLFLASGLFAQSIRFAEDRQVFLLTTSQSSYAMGIAPDRSLRNIYWGAPLWSLADLPALTPARELSSFDPRQMMENEEFPGWGGTRYYEPALKIVREDGDRDLVLQYVSHRIAGNGLDISLKDIRDSIEVTLHYRVYSEHGIISRSATIRNGTPQPLTIESAQAAAWYMPAGAGYQLSYLSGRWAAETQLVREPIHEGMKVLESRKGHTSHGFNPWFAIDQGDANEESGRVWFGALAWSGNWRITVEQTPYRQVRVTGGFNSFDFSYPLKPGESLDTPAFYGGFSAAGFGGASRTLHRFERERILPGGAGARLRPVLYNSWEATEFDVDEAGQKALAGKAAALGVELFVMDDGWFGARRNDHAGLGDWVPNAKKFPNGLKPLIDSVNALGMDFGLWVEPEMVNADSDLYRAHPDWVIHFDGRPRSELRTQMVLNLARDDVREYVFGMLDKLATDYPIRYLKWERIGHFPSPDGRRPVPPMNANSGLPMSATYIRSSTAFAPNILVSKSSPAPAAVDASTWESSNASTKSGRRTTPTPSTACAFRRVSPRRTRRALCRRGSPTVLTGSMAAPYRCLIAFLSRCKAPSASVAI